MTLMPRVVTSGQDSSPVPNLRLEIIGDVLCHWHLHILQSLTWTILDPCQLDCDFHTPSML